MSLVSYGAKLKTIIKQRIGLLFFASAVAAGAVALRGWVLKQDPNSAELRAGKRVDFTLVGLKVDPPDSSVLLKGANLFGESSSQKVPGQIRIDDISSRVSKEKPIIENRSNHPAEVPSGIPTFAIDRSYVTYGFTYKYDNPSPVHIEISHAGYKTWSSDAFPKDGVIEIIVKLEKNP